MPRDKASNWAVIKRTKGATEEFYKLGVYQLAGDPIFCHAAVTVYPQAPTYDKAVALRKIFLGGDQNSPYECNLSQAMKNKELKAIDVALDFMKNPKQAATLGLKPGEAPKDLFDAMADQFAAALDLSAEAEFDPAKKVELAPRIKLLDQATKTTRAKAWEPWRAKLQNMNLKLTKL